MVDTYNSIIAPIKGISKQIKEQKEKVVTIIEQIKKHIPINDALQLFKISRATYQNYKTLVLNKCDSSYFLWCVKKYSHQLLKSEINQIKYYMENKTYQYWSKSSLYWLAVRNKDIGFCLATWYKYCKLLGYKSNRHLQKKVRYDSLKSTQPNEKWSADVTIFKTLDNKKHYIHFLMDHYSKKILGYSVATSSKPSAIKKLLQNAYEKYNIKESIAFITDGGVENCNEMVSSFINSKPNIIHLIAQKDITFSNSAIEAFNKIIKHQFLLPRDLTSLCQLNIALDIDIAIYNNLRPQHNLKGNTPNEIYAGIPVLNTQHCEHFKEQKAERLIINNKNKCKSCL